MRLEPIILTPNFGELSLTVEGLVRAWGYTDLDKAAPFLPIAEKLLAEAPLHMDARAGYRWLGNNSTEIHADELQASGVTFHTGEIIAGQLSGVSSIVLFTSTLGSGFDEWCRRAFEADDALAGYIIDTIGSVAVEAITDWLETRVIQELTGDGLGCSNRFSPGYCGWDVKEQHKLFSLLPDGFCGINLTGSALMVPLKSVSGIIGVGPGVQKKDYPCAACSEENCIRQNLYRDRNESKGK